MTVHAMSFAANSTQRRARYIPCPSGAEHAARVSSWRDEDGWEVCVSCVRCGGVIRRGFAPGHSEKARAQAEAGTIQQGETAQ